MDAYLFIDTNILLDFYRVRSREAGLSTLRHIEDNHARIITSAQVEMEFKKNRQRVILETHQALKTDFAGLLVPPLLAESKQSRALSKCQKSMKGLSGKLKTRLGNVLREPARYDPVYRTLQRLFKDSNKLNLGRHNKLRSEIRELAWKRFILGYPPRKNNDTSMGDAINWEWVIRCASDNGCDIVIVTRDSDYGVNFNGRPILNDWLEQEFKERISRKRKIVLTERLSEGLKAAKVKVTREEERSEEELISVAAQRRIVGLLAGGQSESGSEHRDVWRRLFESFLRTPWEGASDLLAAQDEGEVGDTARSEARLPINDDPAGNRAD